MTTPIIHPDLDEATIVYRIDCILNEREKIQRKLQEAKALTQSLEGALEDNYAEHYDMAYCLKLVRSK